VELTVLGGDYRGAEWGRSANSLVHGAQSPISISDDVDKHGEGIQMVCMAHSAKYLVRQKM